MREPTLDRFAGSWDDSDVDTGPSSALLVDTELDYETALGCRPERFLRLVHPTGKTPAEQGEVWDDSNPPVKG